MSCVLGIFRWGSTLKSEHIQTLPQYDWKIVECKTQIKQTKSGYSSYLELCKSFIKLHAALHVTGFLKGLQKLRSYGDYLQVSLGSG